MFNSNLQVLIFILTIFVFTGVNGSRMSNSLDNLGPRRSLRHTGWAINGHYKYVENGTDLEREFIDNFPAEFNFGKVNSTKGIWVIVYDSQYKRRKPDEPGHGRAIFKFQATHRLVDALSIIYILGGEAELNFKETEKSEPFHTIKNDGAENYYFTSIGISFEQSGNFIIEAIITKPEDFILIDKLEAFYTFTPFPTVKIRPFAPPQKPTPAGLKQKIMENSSSSPFSKSAGLFIMLLGYLTLS